MAPSATVVEESKPSLTSNDSAVLQALFDAESSPSAASSVAQTDESLPALPHISPSDLPALQERELEAIRPLQDSDTAPSRIAIEGAISELSAIVKSHPDYASAYVNRAQALRLLMDRERESNGPLASSHSHCAQILDDLARTISILTPSSPTMPVSPLQSRILSNAHTHRAYLLFRASRSNPSPSPATEEGSDPVEQPEPAERALLPPHIRKLGAEQLEELASWDFQQGGRYGNPVAKQLAVHTNPYAKMCGAIVRDAMRAEIEEWAGQQGIV